MPTLIQKKRTSPISFKEKITRLTVYEYWQKTKCSSLLSNSLPVICGCFIYYQPYVFGKPCVILLFYVFPMTDYDQYD